MRVLIIKSTPNSIILNTYNHQEIGIAKAFKDININCDIVCVSENETSYMKSIAYKNSAINIHYIKAKIMFNIVFYDNNEISTLIEEYDYVITHEIFQYESFKLSKLIPEKLVILHGPYKFGLSLLGKCKSFILYLLFFYRYKKNNVSIIAKSKLAKIFLNRLGFFKVKYIPIGLDHEMVNMSESDFSKALKSRKNGNQYLYVGKIERRRNIKFLFDVFARLKDFDKQSKLVIIGDFNSRYGKKMLKYANDLCILNSIIIKDKLTQNEIGEIYNLSDAFLFPTKYDIYGMVLLESIYYKLSIYSSNNGGSSSLDNYKNLYVVTNFNVEEWVDTIKQTSNNFHFSKNVSEFNTSWNSLIDEYINVFQEI
ncbi:MAG: glycosyltransferase family 4 protein [Acholeplasmataceae bacterium]